MNERFMATAEDIGLNPEKVEGLLARVQREVDAGLLPSAQIAIAREGRVGVFETYGAATNESLYPIFSSTKAVTSAAGWLLFESGDLQLDEIVADIVPEFGTNGKEVITVQQLFLHTAGFPSAPFRPSDWLDKDRRNERYSSWTLNWEPGSRFEYHPTSSMWMIAEIIERRTGRDFVEFVRTEIQEKLKLDDFFVGLPDDQNARVATLTHSGDPMTSEDYARLGIPEPPVTEVTEEAILSFNDPGVRAVGVPGGGAVMSAAAVALFYQGLLHGGSVGHEKVWQDSTLNFAREVRSADHIDQMSGVPVNRALGVVVAGDEKRNFRGFGHTNSSAAFGHGGAGGQIAWGDPETGISIGYLTNGHDRNPLRQGRRGVAISSLAADLL